MSKITGPSLIRNGDVVALSASAAREAIKARAAGLVDLAMQQSHARATFGAFERLLMVEELALARAVLSLFLAASEERVRNALGARVARDARVLRRAPAQQRGLLTWFGLVRYERTNLREVVDAGQQARGFHPLDVELDLLADRVSPNLLSMGVRLATRMAFSEARELLGWFLIEKLWDAGSSVHRQGSPECHAWVEQQKDDAGRSAPKSGAPKATSSGHDLELGHHALLGVLCDVAVVHPLAGVLEVRRDGH